MGSNTPGSRIPAAGITPDTFDLFLFLIDASQKMRAIGSVSRDFGSGDVLTYAEIKVIMTVGRNPKINITGLARSLGITKSTASLMTRKLSEKNLVKKSHDPANDKEVVLSLTPRGRISYHGYDQFHAKFDEIMEQNLGPLTSNETETLQKITAALEKTEEWFRLYGKPG